MTTDLEKLQGVWTIASLEVDEQEYPASGLSDSQFIIEKDTFKSVGMGATYEGAIEIDQETKPKTFDLCFTSGPEKGNRNLGIYKLDGDTWTLCLATRGGKRPRKFASEAGTGFALEILQRGTESRLKLKPKQKASIGSDGAATGVATELEGEWKMVSAVFNGSPMDESMVQWCKRITHGDMTTVMAGPQTMLKASFTLDGSKTPSTIDYVNLAGAAKGKSQAGIYDLRAGILRICMAAPGGKRPTDFVSKPGDGRSFTTWRR